MYIKYSRWFQRATDSNGNCVYESGTTEGPPLPLIGDFDTHDVDLVTDYQDPKTKAYRGLYEACAKFIHEEILPRQ